jgi:hypothetical protein
VHSIMHVSIDAVILPSFRLSYLSPALSLGLSLHPTPRPAKAAAHAT